MSKTFKNPKWKSEERAELFRLALGVLTPRPLFLGLGCWNMLTYDVPSGYVNSLLLKPWWFSQSKSCGFSQLDSMVDLSIVFWVSHSKWWIFPSRFLGLFTRPGRPGRSSRGPFFQEEGILTVEKRSGGKLARFEVHHIFLRSPYGRLSFQWSMKHMKPIMRFFLMFFWRFFFCDVFLMVFLLFFWWFFFF